MENTSLPFTGHTILEDHNNLNKIVNLEMKLINTLTMLIITMTKNEFNVNLRITADNLIQITSPVIVPNLPSTSN